MLLKLFYVLEHFSTKFQHFKKNFSLISAIFLAEKFIFNKDIFRKISAIFSDKFQQESQRNFD